MYKAIGIIELKSIPKGVEAADAALKSAGVDFLLKSAEESDSESSFLRMRERSLLSSVRFPRF